MDSAEVKKADPQQETLVNIPEVADNMPDTIVAEAERFRQARLESAKKFEKSKEYRCLQRCAIICGLISITALALGIYLMIYGANTDGDGTVIFIIGICLTIAIGIPLACPGFILIMSKLFLCCGIVTYGPMAYRPYGCYGPMAYRPYGRDGPYGPFSRGPGVKFPKSPVFDRSLTGPHQTSPKIGTGPADRAICG